jgi:hypothetical protein
VTKVRRLNATGLKADGKSEDRRRWEHVERIGAEHPPIDINTVDFTVRRPNLLLNRYAPVLDYMARAELEVERNVLELATVLPDAPDIDRHFYADVWHHQEAQHGLILDRLLVELGHRPAQADLSTISPKIRIVGALGRIQAFQDVVRMLYYLTGLTTERSALMAYYKLDDGIRQLGEIAMSDTIITPIRRQEPGHHAYYQMSSQALWRQLSIWQRWLVRRLRAITFVPVAASTPEHKADVGDMMISLGLSSPAEAAAFTEQIAHVERDLLWAREAGMRVPSYVARAFAAAVESAQSRSKSGADT